MDPLADSMLLRQAFLDLPVAAAILDEDGRWVTLNHALEQFLGLKDGEVPSGHWIEQLVDAEGVPAHWDEVVSHRSDTASFPAPWRRADHHVCSGEVHLRRLGPGEARPLLLMTVDDVTARLPGGRPHPAQFDHLTGLVTNALFLDRLQQALLRLQRHGGELALVMLDVDGLRRVNEQHGTGKGDEVVREVARRLRQCVRRSDTLGRLGGDEFALILEEVGSSLEAMTLGAKLCDAIAQPYEGVQLPAPLTASIGIVMSSPEADAWALLRRADQAMYKVKSAGGGSYQLWP